MCGLGASHGCHPATLSLTPTDMIVLMTRYAVVLGPEMIGVALHLPAGCREVERNESAELLVDQRGPGSILECDNEDFDLLSITGIVSIEPL